MIRGEKDYRWQRGSREVDEVDHIGHCKEWSFYSEGKEGHGKVLSSCIILLGPDTFTSWQIEGEKVEEVTDFLFLGFKITADGDCSHNIKRHLLLGRKAMANLGSILKSRDVLFANKDPSSQSYCFSSSHVQTWKLAHEEDWVPKSWCFWIVVLEKILRFSWTSRRSNQWIWNKKWSLCSHWLNGYKFEQTMEDSERQGSLVCYSPRGHKELDTT